MAVHNIIGKEGEKAAREYLESKGYKIVKQNYRTKRGEIDIIAKRKNVLVFVEVRTKRDEQFGTPEETIDYAKCARLQRNAVAYTRWQNQQGPYRIDAVCLVIDEQAGLQRIDHYEGICG